MAILIWCGLSLGKKPTIISISSLVKLLMTRMHYARHGDFPCDVVSGNSLSWDLKKLYDSQMSRFRFFSISSL